MEATERQGAPVIPELTRFLTMARRRWLRRTVSRALIHAAMVAAGTTLLLLAAAGTGVFPETLRPWLRWLPLAAAAAVLLEGGLRLMARAPDHRAVALRMEESSPELEHLPTVLLELGTDHPYRIELRRRLDTRLQVLTPERILAPAATQRTLVVAAALVAAALGMVSLSGGPATVWAAWGPGASGESGGAARTPTPAAPEEATPLAELQIRITPPAYTGASQRVEELSGVVTALAGSRLELSGTGGGPGLAAALVDGENEAADLDVVRERLRWRTTWTLAVGHRGVVLTDDEGRERVVPVAVVEDAPPEVELLAPQRDFVLATGSGAIDFTARAHDLFGIDDFRLEWVHTRGSGESFDFREGTLPWTRTTRMEDGGAVEGTLTLDLDAMALGPGDVLHLRAVATDGNHVTGPGTGVSATRQIRIIREGEEMSVDALVGFPLEVDQQPVLSQRMILLMTEELVAMRSTLSATELRRETQHIADEQARLRTQVAEQIYSRATGAMESLDTHLGHDELGPPRDSGAHAHEVEPAASPEPSGSRYGVASIFDPTADDEEGDSAPPPAVILDDPFADPDPAGTQVGSYEVGGAGSLPTGFGQLDDLGHDHDSDPVLSVNRPLLAVHDAMWASEGELRAIDPEASLPHQRMALERLQALREAERVFPRGSVTVPPVDVEAARGTGALDDATPEGRTPWSGARSTRAWLARVEGALGALTGALAGPDLDALAVAMVADAAVEPDVVGSVVRASQALGVGDSRSARTALLEARRLLDPATHAAGPRKLAHGPALPSSALSALAARADPPVAPDGAGASASTEPFVFATLRYESGNWDSAPLVPQNLIHSLAQYTDLPVAPEGVVVDLSSNEIFRYPVLYLTGHLPVRFSTEEALNLEAYVERGGFIFMDDHNHDVDGAFHRTATAELERIFGAGALEPIPADHELYSTFFHFEDGPPITSHELSGWGDGLIHRELFGVMEDGRIGVLYSNKDYSSEWSYHAVNKRFLAVDNTRFGVNVLLYALTR